MRSTDGCSARRPKRLPPSRAASPRWWAARPAWLTRSLEGVSVLMASGVPPAPPAHASAAGGHAHAQQDPDRAEAVAPGDVLALGVGAAVVGDRHLVDAQLPAADPAGDLGLDPEVVLAQRQRLQHLGAKRLVAGLH